MSTFKVLPNALRSYAGTISGAGGSVGGGGVNLAHIYINDPGDYVDKYVKIDSSDFSEVFKLVVSSNTKLVGNLHTGYEQIWPVLSSSGVALSESADRYQETDESVNEKIDHNWPGAGKVTPLDDEAGGGTVSDPSGPLEETPESETEIPDPVHWIMDQAGWLSLGNDILKIASLFGFDPGALLTKAIAGDYSLVARAGNAAKALAEFEHNTAQTVAAGLATMQKSWTGNAADAATSYFDQMANAFDAHADQLDEVSTKYDNLAQAVAQVAVEFSSVLADVIDWLIKCAASLAAASCLQEVPGVDVLIDLIGAYEVWRTKEAVEKFIDICTRVTQIAEGVLGATLFIAGACEPGSATTDFPTSAYSNGAQQ